LIRITRRSYRETIAEVRASDAWDEPQIVPASYTSALLGTPPSAREDVERVYFRDEDLEPQAGRSQAGQPADDPERP
jgi:hypothetical protein